MKDKKLHILLIGSGGREHAIAHQLAHSPRTTTLYVAPGNPGTATLPNTQNVAIAADDIEALLHFALEKKIDLTVVGPEAPLALGLVDTFQAHQLLCFGPTQAAAQLETSKAFCKAFLHTHNIPTASFAVFTEQQAAIDYLDTQSYPIVIKASGLAAGKGVIIAATREEAVSAINGMLDGGQFGEAGQEIIIETFLTGEELSFIVMVDGDHVVPLASSQDHKRLGEGDTGPNTGGMGAYSPAPRLTPALSDKIMETVIHPTIAGLKQQGIHYQGFLYAGLMISESDDIMVLEYNCRLGDPETQAILPRLTSDLATLCLAGAQGQLDTVTVTWNPQPALCVVLASGGYPTHSSPPVEIAGLDAVKRDDLLIFHAGTAQKENRLMTAGGRVLSVVALGDTLQAARDAAYGAIEQITWDGMQYRRDIAHRALD